MASKLDAHLGFQQSVLQVRAKRHEMISSNIANADTPGYKAKDLDFKGALNDALAGKTGSNGVRQALTDPAHIKGQDNGDIFSRNILYRHIAQPSADGNTVDMDAERNEFADNALRYEASVNMVNSKIGGLLSAIKGQ